MTGNRVSTVADAAGAGWYSIPSVHKPYQSRSQLAGPVVVGAELEAAPSRDRDQYYSSVGRQNAMAFNRHVFRRSSARSLQPF